MGLRGGTTTLGTTAYPVVTRVQVFMMKFRKWCEREGRDHVLDSSMHDFMIEQLAELSGKVETLMNNRNGAKKD